MEATRRHFSTGLRFLDRRIGGGLVPGELLALTAPPGSQSELLLAQLASVRRSVVVSTTRSKSELEAWVDANVTNQDVTTIPVDAETFVEDPESVVESMQPESFFIVDSMDGLETVSRDRFLSFLDTIKGALRETDNVGVLHCSDTASPPPRRSLTLHRADYVWKLEVLPLSREVKTRLLVTKARLGRALTEPIPVTLTDEVRIDTSRRI